MYYFTFSYWCTKNTQQQQKFSTSHRRKIKHFSESDTLFAYLINNDINKD